MFEANSLTIFILCLKNKVPLLEGFYPVNQSILKAFYCFLSSILKAFSCSDWLDETSTPKRPLLWTCKHVNYGLGGQLISKLFDLAVTTEQIEQWHGNFSHVLFFWSSLAKLSFLILLFPQEDLKSQNFRNGSSITKSFQCSLKKYLFWILSSIKHHG